PSEYTTVELPLIAQLQTLGWHYLGGDIYVPSFTERETFHEILLRKRLSTALKRINLTDAGQPWLDDSRINDAISRLEHSGTHKLMEANRIALALLLSGTQVEGDPHLHQGKTQTIHYLDFEHIERNDFLVINQFRVDIPGTQNYIVPDIVLFVNGI